VSKQVRIVGAAGDS